VMNGTVIADRYRLDGRLGVGGMSTVHDAFDTRLERRVAVKLLAEHLADDPAFISRFRREALAAARLVHPNIVQVFDFGLEESSARHYIVMELVEGRSCAEILRDEGQVSPEETVNIVGQACRGLDHAHRNRVIHRDVKPGNLLLSEEGIIKLADFGIAKAAEQSSITQAGSVLGTAAYLSPEQARGEEAGTSTDLYALGVVTYQLLSGRLPYEATSLSELAIKQQSEQPPRLDELGPGIPRALATAVERSLALEPRARYDSAPAMASALQAALDGVEPEPAGAPGEETAATRMLGGAAATDTTHALSPGRAPQPVREPRRPRPAPRPPPGVPPTGARGPAPARPRKRRRWRRWVALLCVLGLLAGGAAAAIALSDSADSQPKLRQVIYRDVPQAIDELKQLIDDNTR